MVRPGPVAGATDGARAAALAVGGSDNPEPGSPDDRARARAFAQPLLTGQVLDTGEEAWAHAEGVAGILHEIGAAPSLCAAAYLVYAGDFLTRPEDVIAKAFGPDHAGLVQLTRQLVRIQRAAREAHVQREQRAQQTERVRKMLLAFSRDMRVVLLRLASRLQTLRWHVLSATPCPGMLATESQQVFAPLASRLGIWQIKWELEDLSFQLQRPQDYRRIAALLDQSRAQREQAVQEAAQTLAEELAAAGVSAQVQGRSKHLYSIWKKMQGKALDFDQVFDVRALRVIVDDVPACYAALSRVHERYAPVAGEYDDYIARPKPNGYQSLHTVVRDDAGRAVEIQIRSAAMHAHAEVGVAAHWAYKEAGARGYAGTAQTGEQGERVAEARKAVLRQLLAWERDTASAESLVHDDKDADGSAPPSAADPPADDRIYVFTPQAAIVELPAGATPVDFAYALHTDVGHRCRGARVDAAMVPLNTALASGQTVEVVTVREGGPSMDWLNSELGYLRSPRSKAKVRAWFNAQAQAQTVARGRDAVERLLQREGRTAVKLDELAQRLGFKSADALFEVVGKDEFSLRHVEAVLRPVEPIAPVDAVIGLRKPSGPADGAHGGVLVVGVESLLTTLSRCCRPAPPDAITGYVTRGRGVAIHRNDCSNLRHMAAKGPERVIPVAWGAPAEGQGALYPADVVVEATDRPGMLRDISEVFAREKTNVTGVHTQSVRNSRGGTAWMTFTVEVTDAQRLRQVLGQVAHVAGVRHARRR